MNGYPLIMQSEIPSAAMAAGTIFVPEERVFKNTTLHWLRIHRIGIHGFNGQDYIAENVLATALIDWSIRFGHTEVTNGFAPLEATTWRPAEDEPAGFVEFSKPVYLAPGDRLDVKLRINATPVSTERLFLAAWCTPVDRPDAIRIPTLFGWRGAARGDDSGAFSEEVPVGTLYNEFDEDMHIERLIGTTNFYTDEAGFHYEMIYPMLRQILLDLELQDGTKITRDPTPMGSLFDLVRRSWLVNFRLPSKGYIKAAFSGNLTGGVSATDVRNYIGMLGYRTIG